MIKMSKMSKMYSNLGERANCRTASHRVSQSVREITECRACFAAKNHGIIFALQFFCRFSLLVYVLFKVQVDIAELRQKWVQLRVDRVTHNKFKLYQVCEHLKHSKV